MAKVIKDRADLTFNSNSFLKPLNSIDETLAEQFHKGQLFEDGILLKLPELEVEKLKGDIKTLLQRDPELGEKDVSTQAVRNAP